jgi:HAD superfamily hydrolase (TIGR01549 family)
MFDAIKAVLFDLDGTLLDTNMDVFLPHYFERLAASVAHIVPPDQLLPRLMQATRAVLANDGQRTNEEVFATAFYPAIGISREELEPLFTSFYMHQFPKLRVYTRQKPEARLVVEAAMERGHDVVIATNPLFPSIAIQQRLEWAGVAGFPYRLVTCYENSRAAKPNLLYFQHICAAIDQPPEHCLVVGDEDMDMVAGHLGCPTFLVPSPRTALEPGTPPPTCQGTLSDLLELLQ